MSEKPWLWEEKLVEHFNFPYQLFSLLLGTIVFIIYFLFSLFNHDFFNIFYPFDMYHFLETSSLSTLIAMEVGVIHYLANESRGIIKYLDSLYSTNLYIVLDSNVRRLKWRIFIYVLIAFPFIIIKIKEGNLLPFYSADIGNPNHTILIAYSNLILDIYNYFIEYLSLFLLGDIVWVLINISEIFEKIRCNPYGMPPKPNVFSLYLKLKPINYFTLRVLAYYFLIITLAILSYVTPYKDIPNQIPNQWVALIVLLLIGGLIFFLVVMGSVRRLLNIRIENELDEINKKRQDQLEKIKEIASEDDYSKRLDEIRYISSMMEILKAQEEGIMENYDRAFSITRNITIISAFITSSLIPLVTLLKSTGFEIMSLLPK